MSTTTFAARGWAALEQHGPLCVGLDPHPGLLRDWGLADSAEGLRQFCDVVLDAAAGRVAAVKPQSAFFERHGSAGIAVLEGVLSELRSAGTLSLLDVKRGDVDSTMTAYAQAYLADVAPLAADAVTLSPYLGYGSLRPAVELAGRSGRGVFVVALTSNAEGPGVQHVGAPSVAARVVAEAAADNAGAEPVGHVGLVVGATVGAAPQQLGIDLAAANALVLAPGVGAQGGTPTDLAATFAGVRGRVLASVSRDLLRAGPDPGTLRAALDRWSADLARALHE